MNDIERVYRQLFLLFNALLALLIALLLPAMLFKDRLLNLDPKEWIMEPAGIAQEAYLNGIALRLDAGNGLRSMVHAEGQELGIVDFHLTVGEGGVFEYIYDQSSSGTIKLRLSTRESEPSLFYAVDDKGRRLWQEAVALSVPERRTVFASFFHLTDRLSVMLNGKNVDIPYPIRSPSQRFGLSVAGGSAVMRNIEVSSSNCAIQDNYSFNLLGGMYASAAILSFGAVLAVIGLLHTLLRLLAPRRSRLIVTAVNGAAFVATLVAFAVLS